MASQTPIPKNILVFGATGAIGKYIIEELYNARSSFEKIAFFTSKATAENKADEIKSWREKGVDVIVGDVTSEDDISKAYEGMHMLFPPTPLISKTHLKNINRL
jgi:NAD(P)-dependent dehydrogenase (short-subunit alcohol dehydrogenase family)